MVVVIYSLNKTYITKSLTFLLCRVEAELCLVTRSAYKDCAPRKSRVGLILLNRVAQLFYGLCRVMSKDIIVNSTR